MKFHKYYLGAFIVAPLVFYWTLMPLWYMRIVCVCAFVYRVHKER